ncbi:MAG: dipeptidase [Oscillospiraceae bacterium]|nr:dipeptidase [Oscillospiraceae bacterium]
MKLPLFDAHCDTLFAMRDTGQAIERNNLHVDLNRAERYTPYAQFFALFGFHGRQCFDAEYKLFQGALANHPDRMIHCRTADQARAAARSGKIAAFLSIEGAELIECSLDQLREAHGLGVRMLTLTWNNPNGLSGTNVQESERGLSHLGRQFVRTCEELGIIVDVAHLSEPGFWDVVEVARKPFIASHSNAKHICPHSRNLTDDQFRALIEAGGVAGINLYTDFLGEDPDTDTVIAHIEHFLSLGGERSIAFGADLDGCDQLPRGIRGIQDMEKIGGRMLQKNYPESLIYDIFYHNLMRVVDDVCGI